MPLTSLDRLLFIRQVPIFRELRDDFLMRLVPIMEEMYFNSGHAILIEGQDGQSMYIVVSGRVTVHLKGQEVAQFKSGDCFGEMSVFDAEPRSASVTSLTPCICLVLNQQQLYEAIDETPGIAVNIIRLLSRRIRELNDDLNRFVGGIANQESLVEPPWPPTDRSSSQDQLSSGVRPIPTSSAPPPPKDWPYSSIIY